MRPFNPYVEDIDMYLEEAKERHLFVPNQEKLKAFAARVNAQNEAIVKRDEKARQINRLKTLVQKDEKEEEEKRKKEDAAYKKYVYEFDKKYKRGQYDPANMPTPAYTGWQPRMWSENGIEVLPHFEPNKYSLST